MGNWKSDYIAVKFSPEQVDKMKDEFGQLLAKHNRDSDKAFVDPQMAVIFKYDISAQLYAKNNWIFDEDVKNRIEYYLNDGLSDILPTKEKVAKMFLEIANETLTPREKILALKEYSEIMGYTAKEENQMVGQAQNVILVTDNGSKLSWEEKAKVNQYQLKEKTEKLLAENE